jgi:hypothetical protein
MMAQVDVSRPVISRSHHTKRVSEVMGALYGTRGSVDAEKLISKLQSEEGSRGLATLSVDGLLAKPVRELVDPKVVRAVGRRLLEAWVKSAGTEQLVTRVVEDLVQRLQAQPKSVRDVMPAELRKAAREIFGRPFSPDRRVVLTVIDRPPTRELVRELLLTTVLEFGRKASAPVAGMARGLGSLAKFAGETVKARSGGLGSLVGAVSGEVERQLEKRAVEFVDASIAGVFGQIADALSDPKRAEEAAELRMAIFDGALELTGPQLAREVMNADVAGGSTVVREGLARWVASAEADAQVEKWVSVTLERDGAKSGKDLLTELGMLDVVREVASEQLAVQIRAVTGGAAFAEWVKQQP